jgi:hypothetical protein
MPKQMTSLSHRLWAIGQMRNHNPFGLGGMTQNGNSNTNFLLQGDGKLH